MKKPEKYTDRNGDAYEYGRLEKQFNAYVEKYLNDLIEKMHDQNRKVSKQVIDENVYDVYYVDDVDNSRTSYTKISLKDKCLIEITKHDKYEIIGDIWIYER